MCAPTETWNQVYARFRSILQSVHNTGINRSGPSLFFAQSFPLKKKKTNPDMHWSMYNGALYCTVPNNPTGLYSHMPAYIYIHFPTKSVNSEQIFLFF
jgi:hypothetical protein